ncbi:MAG: hypothetical protein HYZ54_13390, partial [Ignavibacteriae bacterium]|nr:hypothetical protein [Ignavibacteriota bacterium]
FGKSYWGASGTLVDECYMDTVAAPQWQWEYRYSAGGERESKRHTVAPLDGYGGYNHLWTYYLLGGNKQQLAVYNGRETIETNVCSDIGHRVHFYPTEYLTYGNGSSALITTRPDSTHEYKIVDHLGSTRVVLNDTGGVISQYDFEPFGKVYAQTGAGSRKSFIDREKDEESGTGNMGVRQLDGDRFTSVDALWEKYRAWSPYQYANNNPLRIIDPSGMAGTEVYHGDDDCLDAGGQKKQQDQKKEDENMREKKAQKIHFTAQLEAGITGGGRVAGGSKGLNVDINGLSIDVAKVSVGTEKTGIDFMCKDGIITTTSKIGVEGAIGGSIGQETQIQNSTGNIIQKENPWSFSFAPLGPLVPMSFSLESKTNLQGTNTIFGGVVFGYTAACGMGVDVSGKVGATIVTPKR